MSGATLSISKKNKSTKDARMKFEHWWWRSMGQRNTRFFIKSYHQLVMKTRMFLNSWFFIPLLISISISNNLKIKPENISDFERKGRNDCSHFHSLRFKKSIYTMSLNCKSFRQTIMSLTPLRYRKDKGMCPKDRLNPQQIRDCRLYLDWNLMFVTVIPLSLTANSHVCIS